MRSDGRKNDEMRSVRITPGYLSAPAGSCLVEFGKTRVVCSAMLEETIPAFLKGTGKGWLTAEYSMIPGSSSQRIQRERYKVGGRTHEIQRLIGRSLRACVDLNLLGERSLLIDCDVIDADGGTRTAAITGAYVAVALAVKKLAPKYPTLNSALKGGVAAVSVGIVNRAAVLDLHFDDDKQAEVDMNVVKTTANKYVEIQGTAELVAFDRAQLDELLALADKGIQELFAVQRRVLESL